MWLDDFMAEQEAMGIENKAGYNSFHDLCEAYHQFEYIGELEDERCERLLWEIIRVFNGTYRSTPMYKIKVCYNDCKFYVRCILELLKKSGDRMSLFQKMELYREAGMFSKCVELYASDPQRRNLQIYEELLLRAAQGDSSPFVL